MVLSQREERGRLESLPLVTAIQFMFDCPKNFVPTRSQVQHQSRQRPTDKERRGL
jgi:hypothetical protein